MASVLNHRRSPYPGGNVSRLLFSHYPIDIVLKPSQIKVHLCGLALHLLQFQELMQLAAPPHSSSLPPPLAGILGCSRSFGHSPVRTRPASSSLSVFIRRREDGFTLCELASSRANSNNFISNSLQTLFELSVVLSLDSPLVA